MAGCTCVWDVALGRSLCMCPAQSHHFHRIEQFSFCCDAMSNRASHWGLATCAVTFGHVLYHAEKQHCNDFRRPAATSGDHPVQICGSLQHLIHEIPVAAGYIGASAWVQYPECSLQHAVWLLSTPAPIAWLTGVVCVCVCVFVIRSRISVDRRGEELRVPCSLASQHGLAHRETSASSCEVVCDGGAASTRQMGITSFAGHVP